MANNNLANLIYQTYVAKNEAEGFRPHLGASMGGEPCLRKLWYSFRHVMFVNFDGRMLRLFSRGHREEDFFLDDLKAIGFNIKAEDDNGRQYFFRSPKNAHVGGSGDGFFQAPFDIDVIPAGAFGITEFKTYNTKSFKKLVDAQSVKAVKPLHYSQMNLYMGWSGSQYAIYMAVCKDTDELYIEIMQFDQAEFERVENNMIQVVNAQTPPPPLYTDQTRFECKYCDYNKACYGKPYKLEVNCRTCVYSKPIDDGTWVCQKSKSLPVIDSLGINPSEGCQDHIFIPELIVPFANLTGNALPEDKHQFLEYTSFDGFKKVKNGNVVGIDSRQFAHMIHSNTLFDDLVQDMQAQFGAKVVGSKEVSQNEVA